MQQSGLTDLLPSLLRKTVYVGLSAGSMVMTRFGTTYGNHILPAESDKSLGLVDFAIHPHLDYEWFPGNSLANVAKLAATIPVPSYAIDDHTAIKVPDGAIENNQADRVLLLEDHVSKRRRDELRVLQFGHVVARGIRYRLAGIHQQIREQVCLLLVLLQVPLVGLGL